MYLVMTDDGDTIGEYADFGEARKRAGLAYLVVQRDGEPAPVRRPVPTLTKAQRQALDDLRGFNGADLRHQWPTSRSARFGDVNARWSKRTLDALASAGWAEWVFSPPGAGVLPYVRLRGDA